MKNSILALGRLKDGERNKTEALYEAHLKWRLIAGEVLWFAFEPVKLKLAKNTTYTPDFMLMLADQTIELHEVKGFWQDDARVKIKVAANMYHMFRFVGVTAKPKREGGGWNFEEF